MQEYIKEITKKLKPKWEYDVIKVRNETIKRGQEHNNFEKVNKGASWASLQDVLMVYALVRYYKPHAILEIGTYIGTLTHVMDKAMKDNGTKNGIIFTCDKNFVYINDYNENIQYYNCISTKLLKKLKNHHVKIDFCFIDGGLKHGDNKLIKSLFNNKVIFATHDYKQGQKGVKNIKLMEKIFKESKAYIPENQGVGYCLPEMTSPINSSVGVLVA